MTSNSFLSPHRIVNFPVGMGAFRAAPAGIVLGPAGIGVIDGFEGSFFAASGMALALSGFVSGCAVGPDFEHPASPEVTRYTKEPLATRTSSADVAQGNANHFVNGKDVPAEWWRFIVRPLNALFGRSMDANPNLQATLAALRVARENTTPSKANIFRTSRPTQSEASRAGRDYSPGFHRIPALFNLYTAQLAVTYTFDIWGQIRPRSKSLLASADPQRFQVEAAYLTLTANVVVAAIQEAALRGQIEATEKMIECNLKALDILRKQFDEGYANRNDVAAQKSALAQARANLPPLRKRWRNTATCWRRSPAVTPVRSRRKHSAWRTCACRATCR